MNGPFELNLERRYIFANISFAHNLIGKETYEPMLGSDGSNRTVRHDATGGQFLFPPSVVKTLKTCLGFPIAKDKADTIVLKAMQGTYI